MLQNPNFIVNVIAAGGALAAVFVSLYICVPLSLLGCPKT